MDNHYTYVLLDPRKAGDYTYGTLHFKYEPFYVGKGHGRRVRAHFDKKLLKSEQRKRRNPVKANKILKMMREGHEPIVKYVKQNTSDANAMNLEIRAIELIGRRKDKGPLVNQTDGGDGISGHVPTEDTKTLLRNRTKAFWKSMSEEQYAYMCLKGIESNRKRWDNMTPEGRKALSISLSNASKRFWESLSLEEKRIHRQLLADNTKEFWDSLSKKERASFIDKQNAGKSRMTKEQKAERSKKLFMNGKQYWASLSKSQRHNHIENITAGVLESRPRAVKTYLRTIASMPKRQRAEWRQNISIGLKKFNTENPEAIKKRAEKISETAQARTPVQKKALTKKFRRAQLELPMCKQLAKNKKVSKGLKRYRRKMTDQEKNAESKRQSKSVQSYWDNVSEEEKRKRLHNSHNLSEERKEKKNQKISETIRKQHAATSLYDKRMRSFRVMVGVLCSNYGIEDKEIKERLRKKALL